MKKINKPLSIALALMMCLCLAGCGDEAENKNPGNSTPTSSAAGTSDPAKASDPGTLSDTNNSTPDTPSNADNSEPAPAVELSFEPVVDEVLDIEGNRLTGFGFNRRTVYGNAFGIIISFGSADSYTIDNAPISIIPLGMTDLDEILASGYCQTEYTGKINKEDLVETDFGDGTTGWIYNEEAAKKQAMNCGDYSIDALYEEMKMIELTGAGLSQEEARKQIKIKLANVGLGDER